MDWTIFWTIFWTISSQGGAGGKVLLLREGWEAVVIVNATG